MSYSSDDREMMSAYMALDSSNKEGWGPDGPAVFSAMAFDREKEQSSGVDYSVIAKKIYSRVSNLLKNPLVVSSICNAKFDDGKKTGEEIFDDAFKCGYYTQNANTTYAEMQRALGAEINNHLKNGDKNKAKILENMAEQTENAMLEIAIPVICSGLQDGSIAIGFAEQPDGKIINDLIDSNNEKEEQIQNNLNPVIVSTYDVISILACDNIQANNIEQQ